MARPPNNTLQTRITHLRSSSHRLSATAPSTAAYLGHQARRLSLQYPPTGQHLAPPERKRKRDRPEPENRCESLLENCGACGSPLVPGWTCAVSLEKRVVKVQKGDGSVADDGGLERERRKSRRRKLEWDVKSDPNTGVAVARPKKTGDVRQRGEEISQCMAYACKRCGRTTRVQLPAGEGEKASARQRARVKSADRLEPRAEAIAGLATEPRGPGRVDVMSEKLTTTTLSESCASKVPANASGKRRARTKKEAGLKGMLGRSRRETERSGGLDLMDLMKSV